MVWEPRGCCCFDLRTGSLILGSLVLAFSVLGLILSVNTVVNVDVDLEISKVCADEAVNEAVEDCHSLLKNIVIGFIASRFIIDIVVTILSSLLIHGIRKNMTRLLIPFMCMQVLAISVLVLLALGLLGISAVVGLWKGFFIVLVIFGSVIFLETYFLLVIRAFYYEVRRAKAHVHIALKDEGGFAESQKYYEAKPGHY
ncbi:uncharacterized protein [Palaemon carinicauda]